MRSLTRCACVVLGLALSACADSGDRREVTPSDASGVDAGRESQPDGGAVIGPDSGSSRPCAEVCGGCCTPEGRCMGGDDEAACGARGGICTMCAAGSECREGACRGMRICTAGDDYECGDDTREDWVESQCCVDGVTQCVEGNAYECTTGRVGFEWTGARCCFELEDALCVAGDNYGCGFGSTIEYWTGSLCCVVGAIECFPGSSEYDCTTGRTDRTWTGTHCCTVP